MSRRISQKRRQGISDAVDVSEQEVICDQDMRVETQPRRLVYRRLPGLLVKGGTWPKQTHLACWYCRLAFTTQPIPIVQQYDATKNIYDVYGVACSGPCSKSYIMSLRNNDARTRLMWQTKMLIDVFGWPPEEPIPAAHPWQAIDVFGGYMSITEWRRVVPGIKMQLKMPPFVPFVIFTETEMKGVCHIDQSKPMEALEHVDTLEEQAMQHGAAFSLKGLKRPDTIISTMEQLAAAHPHHAVDTSPHGSIFGEFLATQTLPTPEESQQIRDQREADRKAKRKRKKPSSLQEPSDTIVPDVMVMGPPEPPVPEASAKVNNQTAVLVQPSAIMLPATVTAPAAAEPAAAEPAAAKSAAAKPAAAKSAAAKPAAAKPAAAKPAAAKPAAAKPAAANPAAVNPVTPTPNNVVPPVPQHTPADTAPAVASIAKSAGAKNKKAATKPPMDMPVVDDTDGQSCEPPTKKVAPARHIGPMDAYLTHGHPRSPKRRVKK